MKKISANEILLKHGDDEYITLCLTNTAKGTNYKFKLHELNVSYAVDLVSYFWRGAVRGLTRKKTFLGYVCTNNERLDFLKYSVEKTLLAHQNVFEWFWKYVQSGQIPDALDVKVEKVKKVKTLNG